MKVLVTGSSGFIGRSVVHELLEHGHSVIPFDAANGDYLHNLLRPNHPSDGVDAVCHLAAVGDVYECQKDPVNAATVNVAGTAAVIAACLAWDAHLVHASTWEVAHPHEPYAITKAAAEQLVMWAGDHKSLLSCALRLGSAYGPGMRSSQVIRKFIDLAQSGKPLTIHGDGSQFRQWTHTRDIARAFRIAVEQGITGVALPVVASEPTSIRQIAEAIAKRYGVGCTFGPPRPADVPPEIVDTTETAEVLGWRAEVPFGDGLAELMA